MRISDVCRRGSPKGTRRVASLTSCLTTPITAFHNTHFAMSQAKARMIMMMPARLHWACPLAPDALAVYHRLGRRRVVITFVTTKPQDYSMADISPGRAQYRRAYELEARYLVETTHADECLFEMTIYGF